jgi:hypothetical protein
VLLVQTKRIPLLKQAQHRKRIPIVIPEPDADMEADEKKQEPADIETKPQRAATPDEKRQLQALQNSFDRWISPSKQTPAQPAAALSDAGADEGAAAASASDQSATIAPAARIPFLYHSTRAAWVTKARAHFKKSRAKAMATESGVFTSHMLAPMQKQLTKFRKHWIRELRSYYIDIVAVDPNPSKYLRRLREETQALADTAVQAEAYAEYMQLQHGLITIDSFLNTHAIIEPVCRSMRMLLALPDDTLSVATGELLFNARILRKIYQSDEFGECWNRVDMLRLRIVRFGASSFPDEEAMRWEVEMKDTDWIDKGFVAYVAEQTPIIQDLLTQRIDASNEITRKYFAEDAPDDALVLSARADFTKHTQAHTRKTGTYEAGEHLGRLLLSYNSPMLRFHRWMFSMIYRWKSSNADGQFKMRIHQLPFDTLYNVYKDLTVFLSEAKEAKREMAEYRADMKLFRENKISTRPALPASRRAIEMSNETRDLTMLVSKRVINSELRKDEEIDTRLHFLSSELTGFKQLFHELRAVPLSFKYEEERVVIRRHTDVAIQDFSLTGAAVTSDLRSLDRLTSQLYEDATPYVETKQFKRNETIVKSSIEPMFALERYARRLDGLTKVVDSFSPLHELLHKRYTMNIEEMSSIQAGDTGGFDEAFVRSYFVTDLSHPLNDSLVDVLASINIPTLKRGIAYVTAHSTPITEDNAEPIVSKRMLFTQFVRDYSRMAKECQELIVEFNKPYVDMQPLDETTLMYTKLRKRCRALVWNWKNLFREWIQEEPTKTAKQNKIDLYMQSPWELYRRIYDFASFVRLELVMEIEIKPEDGDGAFAPPSDDSMSEQKEDAGHAAPVEAEEHQDEVAHADNDPATTVVVKAEPGYLPVPPRDPNPHLPTNTAQEAKTTFAYLMSQIAHILDHLVYEVDALNVTLVSLAEAQGQHVITYKYTDNETDDPPTGIVAVNVPAGIDAETGRKTRRRLQVDVVQSAVNLAFDQIAIESEARVTRDRIIFIHSAWNEYRAASENNVWNKFSVAEEFDPRPTKTNSSLEIEDYLAEEFIAMRALKQRASENMSWAMKLTRPVYDEWNRLHAYLLNISLIDNDDKHTFGRNDQNDEEITSHDAEKAAGRKTNRVEETVWTARKETLAGSQKKIAATNIELSRLIDESFETKTTALAREFKVLDMVGEVIFQDVDFDHLSGDTDIISVDVEPDYLADVDDQLQEQDIDQHGLIPDQTAAQDPDWQPSDDDDDDDDREDEDEGEGSESEEEEEEAEEEEVVKAKAKRTQTHKRGASAANKKRRIANVDAEPADETEAASSPSAKKHRGARSEADQTDDPVSEFEQTVRDLKRLSTSLKSQKQIDRYNELLVTFNESRSKLSELRQKHDVIKQKKKRLSVFEKAGYTVPPFTAEGSRSAEQETEEPSSEEDLKSKKKEKKKEKKKKEREEQKLKDEKEKKKASEKEEKEKKKKKKEKPDKKSKSPDKQPQRTVISAVLAAAGAPASVLLLLLALLRPR